MSSRAEIVRVARTWIGTPFHHAQRKRGLGIDCAGLLVMVARECGLVAPDFDLPPYLARPDGRTMIEWCNKYMGDQVLEQHMRPGDAIVLVTDEYPQHLGVIADYHYGGLSLIHASNTTNPPRVIESRLMFYRGQRFVAAYAFPGIA